MFFVVAVIFSLAATACSGKKSTTGTTDSQPTKAAALPVACELVPKADLERELGHSLEEGSAPDNESTTQLNSRCTYDIPDAVEPLGGFLIVTLKNNRLDFDQYKTRPASEAGPVEPLEDIGEEAYWAPNSEGTQGVVGVKLSNKRYLVVRYARGQVVNKDPVIKVAKLLVAKL
jgi:hypothetical protein